MASTRYLTKSRFKIALDCPNKLFYTKKGTFFCVKKLIRAIKGYFKS